MSKEVKALDVTIMGREFRVSCTDDERSGLLRAVTYLDHKMTEIRDEGKVIGTERIAVLAALNIAHELLTAKVTASGVDLGEVKRRMQHMQATIDAAMSSQDKLF
ncbi:MAG: cell division protein ZapA [Burkholderiales bacterium]|nr:cell division protein ZapA [Burkholderiales bacterium]